MLICLMWLFDRIGSKDARDLLNDQATYYSKYSISSTMGCADNAATNWAVIRK